MRAERQPHHDPRDDPPIAAAERVRVLRGTVVRPERAEHLRPPPPDQGVVDHHVDRRVHAEQPVRDQPGQRQSDPVGVPRVAGEEPAHRVKRHHRGHPRPGQHAHHGAPPGLRHQAGSQQREHRERAPAPEDGPECLQQRTPRVGYGQPWKHRRTIRILRTCVHTPPRQREPGARRCFVTSTPGLWRRAGTSLEPLVSPAPRVSHRGSKLRKSRAIELRANYRGCGGRAARRRGRRALFRRNGVRRRRRTRPARRCDRLEAPNFWARRVFEQALTREARRDR